MNNSVNFTEVFIKKNLASLFSFNKKFIHEKIAANICNKTAQNKSVLRGGLEGMKFAMIMWLAYIIGLQRGG